MVWRPPSPLRRFDPIPNHGLPWWGFAITLFGHAKLGRTLLEEWSARGRDLHLTTHNIHKRSMAPCGIQTRNLSRQAAAHTCSKDSKYQNAPWRYVIHTFLAPLKCKICSRRHYFCVETLNFLCVFRWTVGALNTFWTIATDSGGHTEQTLQQNSESSCKI